MTVANANGCLLHITTLLLVALLCSSASTSSTSSSSSSSLSSPPRNVYWLQENYPNPESNSEECRSNSRICDPDFILDQGSMIHIIEKKIDSFEQHHKVIDCNGESNSRRPLFSIKTAETTFSKNTEEEKSNYDNGDNKDTTDGDDGGVPIQIAVALVRRMDLSPFGEYNDEIDIAAESFATHLHNKWGVGSSSECGSTGVLIFLSIDDRAIYISKGKALVSVLNDKRLDRLINSIKPYLRDEQYMDAIIELIDNISIYIHNGEPSLYEHILHNLDDYGTILIFAVFFLLKMFDVRRQTQSQRDYAHVQSQLNQIDRDRAESLQGIYQCKSCPICLEPFKTINTDTENTQKEDEKEDGTNNNEKSDDDDGNGDSGSDAAAAIATAATTTTTTTTTETTTDEDDDGTNDDEQQKPASADKMSNRIGSDGKPLKLLRCGHVFDETCWSEWIANGRGGSINKCPICQQDVGGGGAGGNSSSSNSSSVRAANATRNISHNASTTLRHRSNSGDRQQQQEEETTTTLVDDDHHQSQQLQQQQQHQNERIIQQYNRERNFRLARLAYRYPRYIQQQQIQRWTSPNYDGSMSRDSSFVRSNPAVQRATSSSGSSYRSSGFGGGGSSGGRGGRW